MHEPKGISTAVANRVYKANGTGSGSWAKVSSDMIQDLAGDAGISGKTLLTNGTNGFTLTTDAAYGAQTITNNVVAFPLVAVADTTFNTSSQFTLLTGVGAPWLSENLFGISFSVDRLTVAVTGVYRISLWMNINQFSGATAKFCVRYRINGTTYALRKLTTKSAVMSDVSQIGAVGIVALTAGDYIQIIVATDTTGSFVIGECANTVTLVRQTA